MSYAALAAIVALLVSHGLAVGLGLRLGRADLAIERHWRKVAEAERDSAEARAQASQPRHTVDALGVVASDDDERLLHEIFGPPDPPGWQTSVESASGPVDPNA